MNGKNVFGALLSLFGAVMGLLLTPLFFVELYYPLIAAEGAAAGCALVVEFIFPFCSDLGMISGILFLVAGIGFLSDDKHSFRIAVVACVLALQGAFWPIIPLFIVGMAPLFAINFLGNLIIFFLLLIFVGRISGKRTLMALLTGMAWILAFMNGIAATNRIETTHLGIFSAVQRLSWVAALGWGVVTVMLVVEPKEWVRKLSLGAGFLAMVTGYPTGMFSPFGGGFSMFLLGPMLSTLLVILFISPKLWEKLVSRKG